MKMDATKKLYFAYGSNMHEGKRKEVMERAGSGSFDFFAVGELRGWRFAINKRAEHQPGMAWANIVKDENSVVHGVLFEIDDSIEERLDRVEGVGRNVRFAYLKEEETHVLCGDKLFKPLIYIAHSEAIEEGLYTTKGYLESIIKGAKEFKLPTNYVEYLKSFKLRV